MLSRVTQDRKCVLGMRNKSRRGHGLFVLHELYSFLLYSAKVTLKIPGSP